MDLRTSRNQSVITNLVGIEELHKEIRALRSLTRENYGATFFEKIEQAKIELSSQNVTTVTMKEGKNKHNLDIDFSEKLTRAEFDRLIGPDLRQVKACVFGTLQQAGLDVNQVDVVLRTGGSSYIPAFIRMLSNMFGESKLKEIDAFSSVASGLAVAAWLKSKGDNSIRQARSDMLVSSPDSPSNTEEKTETVKPSKERVSRSSLNTRQGTNSSISSQEMQAESLDQSFGDSRDGSRGIGFYRREGGRYGFYPSHDDYSEESGPD